MARVVHHDLSFVVPEGWEDASIVTLHAPSPDPFPTLRAKATAPARGNIVLARRDARALDVDLEAFAAGQERMMAELMKDLRVLARESRTFGGAEAPIPAALREYAFATPEGSLQQVQACFRVGDTLFILSGTGSQGAPFEEVRRRFFELAESIRPS